MAGTMTLFAPSSGAVVCYGELLLRMAAPRGEQLLQRPALEVCVGGAEANVAVSLARLGHAARFVGTVPDHALGWHARDVLRGHGVNTDTISADQGRMGLYFLMPGAVLRPSEVLYDRAGSAFALRSAADYDWNAALDGAAWLHVSGVSPAVSAEAGQATLDAVRHARRLGVRVSFDGNYRASLWAARGEDGAALLTQIVAQADLAFIDQRDIALLLRAPQLAHGERASAIRAAFDAWPQLNAIAATSRSQLSVERHQLGATLHTRDGETATAPPRQLADIVDRIGTGDAFAAALLHGILRDWRAADCIRFALAAACSKHSIAGDMHPLSEAQILATMEGSLDVRR
ncbi:sugar kinase [Duganella sp. FT80W]|uniref:Sugar kinase n=1 Tax=Duganella guangzhouensis TaxID=2666084 RepID=A0A6I2KW44_9BURK|nr:sugar kinase [Duganella guangzhouensis]MRW89740.1 sugar kinase [Duganella guangzhouensis]